MSGLFYWQRKSFRKLQGAYQFLYIYIYVRRPCSYDNLCNEIGLSPC